MDQTAKAALLSALRSILIAVGSILAAKGFVNDEQVQQLVGAVMTVLPIVWGVWDKFESERNTKEREAVAVGAGIAQATGGAAPSVSTADAQTIIQSKGEAP